MWPLLERPALTVCVRFDATFVAICFEMSDVTGMVLCDFAACRVYVCKCSTFDCMVHDVRILRTLGYVRLLVF